MSGQVEEGRSVRSAGGADDPVAVIKAEIQRAQRASEQASAKTLELETQLKSERDFRAELERQVKELREAQVALGRLPGGAVRSPELPRTIGDAVRAEIEARKIDDLPSQVRGKLRLSLGKRRLRDFIGHRALELTSTELGALTTRYDDPEVANRVRQIVPAVIDLVPMIRLARNQSSVRMTYKSQHAMLWTQLSAAASSGQANIVLVNVNGLFVGQTLVIGTGGTQETKVIATITVATKTVALTTNLANNQSSGADVVSERFVFTGETKLKPRAKMVFANVDLSVETMATIVKLSKQTFDDIEMLTDELNMELPQNIRTQLSKEILYGPGTTGRWQGILTHASVLTHSQSSIAGDTKVDAIHRAMTLVRLQNGTPTQIVIHPSDAEDIILLKDDQGRYMQVYDGERLWRLPVLETQEIAEGTCLVGDFTKVRVYDKSEPVVEFFEQDEDNVQTNLVTVRCETRAAFGVKEPAAFCKITFS